MYGSGVPMITATLANIVSGRLSGLAVAGVGATAPTAVRSLTAAGARPTTVASTSVCVFPGHLAN